MADKPIRLRLSRKKGFNLQKHSLDQNGLPAVNVARPSRWGNPHRVGDHPGCDRRRKKHTAESAVAEFERYECRGVERGVKIVRELAGKNLACWCPLDSPCHADVLLRIANHQLKSIGDAS